MAVYIFHKVTHLFNAAMLQPDFFGFAGFLSNVPSRIKQPPMNIPHANKQQFAPPHKHAIIKQ